MADVKTLGVAWLAAVLLPVTAAAQDVRAVVAEATRVMGAASVQSITYAGTAAVANFGQSRTISFRLASTTIQNYTHTIDFATGTSRVSGYAAPPAIHGGPPTGPFEELVAPGDAWARQLDIWTTPWGFLRGAAAGPATLRRRTIDDVPYDVVTWTPPHKAPSGQSYRVVGYIGPDRLVERVETWVGHPILGDMHVDTRYSEYRNVGGMLVPGRIRQSRVGMEVFVAVIGGARANPPDLARLLQRSAPEAAPEPPVPAVSERVADGVYRLRGRYEALAVDLGEFAVVVGGGGDDRHGEAILAEVKRLFPRTPLRYVVATHPHFDHAAVLPPFAAQGITILVDDVSRYFVEQALSSPRTLVGDALARSRRKPRVEGIVDTRVLGTGTRRLELYHLPRFEHSDAMLVAYLPSEKILFTADVEPGAPQLAELRLDVGLHVTAGPAAGGDR